MPKQTFLNLPDEKRNNIIDCAIKEFAAVGYHNASISRIVGNAGIAKGSFYQYFDDKEDLYGYVMDTCVVRRKLAISDEDSKKLINMTLTQFLRVMMKHQLSEFSKRPEVLKMSLDYLKHQHEPVQTRIREKYQDLSDDYFKAFIRYAKSKGEIKDKVDTDMLSNILYGASNVIVEQIVTKGHSSLSDDYIDKWVDNLEYILINGVFNRKEG